MLLAFDVGNTHIVMGAFRDNVLLHHWRMSTDKNRSADEYALLVERLLAFVGLDFTCVRGAIVASVVPPATPPLEAMLCEYAFVTPLIVGPGTKTGMPIVCYNPREVGADRIVNAVAGLAKYGAPLILIDFGTATTFCAVNNKGEYVGGAIAPGIGIASEALFQRASKLPRVDIIKPETVIGKDTVSSMQSGLYYGYCGLTEHIVCLMKQELGLGDPGGGQNQKDEKRRQGGITVVATGGLAALVAESCSVIDVVDEDLTLEGLRIIYGKNKLEAGRS
ncbi:MAG: type III pantothenate kinase [Peptococcaceae bacterium]|nr:type III pantothenate kinase [Peptococcaceae bacterium]